MLFRRTPPRTAPRGRAAQRLFRRTLLTLGLVALVAACGPTQGPPDDFYEVDATRECLEDAGFRITTSAREVGFITWTAPAGGFRAYLPEDRNSLTIAFGNTKEEAQRMVKAFQAQARTRQERRRLRSLLEGQGNTVLVWISEPTLEEAETVRGCLK
ncbi:MAG: hypothetical protein M3321_06135 [Actinomycetota bacterium]|nr:hypothetical protein [Actinomycetota bacterium]